MGAAAAFTFLQRQEMLPKYCAVVVIIGLVALVATYNYVRLFESWNQAYAVTGGAAARPARYTRWRRTPERARTPRRT